MVVFVVFAVFAGAFFTGAAFFAVSVSVFLAGFFAGAAFLAGAGSSF